MPYALQITIERVDQGRLGTDQAAAIQQGMTYESENMSGYSKTVVVGPFTGTGTTLTKERCIFKTLALIKSGAVMASVNTALDALSP